MTTSVNWKCKGLQRLYGHSYTAPTPYEHTLQKLGIVITKAYGLHLRKATRKMGTYPPDLITTTPTVPPGFDPLTVNINDSDDTDSVDTDSVDTDSVDTFNQVAQ